MGLAFDCQLSWAYNGEGAYKDAPIKNVVKLLSNMDQYWIVFVAQKKYEANSVDEILEKKSPVKFVCLSEGGLAIKQSECTGRDAKDWTS